MCLSPVPCTDVGGTIASKLLRPNGTVLGTSVSALFLAGWKRLFLLISL